MADVIRALRAAILRGTAAALAIAAIAGGAVAPAAAQTPIYLDRSHSFQERAADLVSRMTTAEKASQMISGSASRLDGGSPFS